MAEVTNRRSRTSRSKGNEGEDRAVELLKREGFEILERNYVIWGGEIDIIALEKPMTLVFVEVKYRRDESFGSGIEAVNKTKQQRLVRCAESFISLHGFEGMSARFDVVEVSGQAIRRIENAFETN